MKETHAVDIPSSAMGKEVSIEIGIFSTDLKTQRLRIKSSEGIPTDDQDTGAVIGSLQL